MIKIVDVYVRTTVSLLQHIDISWCGKNSQHYITAHTDLNKFLIDNYKREIFLTFMLEYCVYVTCSFNYLYLEVIANIQC